MGGIKRKIGKGLGERHASEGQRLGGTAVVGLGGERWGEGGRGAKQVERPGKLGRILTLRPGARGVFTKICPTRMELWPRKTPLVKEPPVHPGGPRERANSDRDSCTQLIEYLITSGAEANCHPESGNCRTQSCRAGWGWGRETTWPHLPPRRQFNCLRTPHQTSRKRITFYSKCANPDLCAKLHVSKYICAWLYFKCLLEHKYA